MGDWNQTIADQLTTERHRKRAARGASPGPLDTPALATSGGWTGN